MSEIKSELVQKSNENLETEMLRAEWLKEKINNSVDEWILGKPGVEEVIDIEHLKGVTTKFIISWVEYLQYFRDKLGQYQDSFRDVEGEIQSYTSEKYLDDNVPDEFADDFILIDADNVNVIAVYKKVLKDDEISSNARVVLTKLLSSFDDQIKNEIDVYENLSGNEIDESFLELIAFGYLTKLDPDERRPEYKSYLVNAA